MTQNMGIDYTTALSHFLLLVRHELLTRDPLCLANSVVGLQLVNLPSRCLHLGRQAVSGTSSLLGGGVSLTGNGRVLRVEQVECGRVPVPARVGKVLGLPHLVGHGTLATTHVGVEDRVSVGNDSEGTGGLLGLLLLLLGSVGLLRVQVLESLSSGGLVRLLGVIDSVSDLDKLVVEVTNGSSDGIVDSSLDSLLDDTGSDALDKLVEQVVLRVSDREGQGVDRGVDRVDSDDGIPLPLDRLELDVNRHTLAGKDDIGDTVVLELGPSSLSSERESDVTDIGLDLRKTQSELVVVGVHRLVELVVWRELERVVALEADDVGEEVGSREDKVLDDEVNVGVREFGSGDGDVANLPDEGGEENVSDVVP